MGSSQPTTWSCGSRGGASATSTGLTLQIVCVGLTWILCFVFSSSEGGEGNIHIAFIFNTSADASQIPVTEFANI